jgi:hypothetical protein
LRGEAATSGADELLVSVATRLLLLAHFSITWSSLMDLMDPEGDSGKCVLVAPFIAAIGGLLRPKGP